jgi:copper chaperone CopZ
MASDALNASDLWTREPASRPDRVRIRARIAGMHCSLCTGTIEKALRRHVGVEKVAVSLTHEQALVEYDPARVQPEALLTTLGQMGYAISDPRKVRPKARLVSDRNSWRQTLAERTALGTRRSVVGSRRDAAHEA